MIVRFFMCSSVMDRLLRILCDLSTHYEHDSILLCSACLLDRYENCPSDEDRGVDVAHPIDRTFLSASYAIWLDSVLDDVNKLTMCSRL